jgi:hypothetical protein
MRTKPEKKNLQQNSKLAQHSCEECRKVGWSEARILEITGGTGIGNARNQHMWHV